MKGNGGKTGSQTRNFGNYHWGLCHGIDSNILPPTIQLHKKIGLEGPVLTLGNQDVWASYDQVKLFFREVDCPWVEGNVTSQTSRLFQDHSEAKAFIHARTFFEMMGINEYYDLDKFPIDAPQILHDLNDPVPPKLHNRFNLILDGGTIEHVFDVHQVMENIVRMCKQSGWTVHITPSSNYIDHGFYSFSPCFFYDFYRANGVSNFICYVLQAKPQDFFARCSIFEYSDGMNLNGLIDPARIAVVFFAAQLRTHSDSVNIPIQGVYQPENGCYRVQNAEGETAGTANDLGRISTVERFLPASLVAYLQP